MCPFLITETCESLCSILLEEKMTKIIFVCHGNICRSPMAEFIFRHLAEEVGRGDEFESSSPAQKVGNPKSMSYLASLGLAPDGGSGKYYR